jgi:two-component system OmpR family response regulator
MKSRAQKRPGGEKLLMIRCLLVDDDADIQELMQGYLRQFGIAVTPAHDGTAMRDALARDTFDILLLDLMLPDDNGLTLCHWLRRRSTMPVIVLTAHGDLASRVLSLEVGADDYLQKPFEPRELVARMRALLRRTQAQDDEHAEAAPALLRFHGWTLDRLQRQLTAPDRVVVPLSNVEFRLLTSLLEHRGRVLTRDRLLDLVRAPGTEVTDRSIDLVVSRLRQKLRDSPRQPHLIRTVRGEGYAFTAPVN